MAFRIEPHVIWGEINNTRRNQVFGRLVLASGDPATQPQEQCERLVLAVDAAKVHDIVRNLVENAIKHGIAPLPAGGTVHVQARRLGAVVEVSVADTGVGFSGLGGSGIGLANIRARLQTLYGEQGVLVLETNQPSGVRASIRLPERQGGGAP